MAEEASEIDRGGGADLAKAPYYVLSEEEEYRHAATVRPTGASAQV